MKLNDRERKVLRILHNFIAIRRRIPSLRELKIKTGRPEEEISQTLQSLHNKEFISWDPLQHNELQVIRSWEEPPPSPPTKPYWEYD